MAIQLPGSTGPIRRLVAIAATAATAALVLSGCAAGQDAQTANQQPPIDGASATAGDLSIRTAAVVASDTGDAYAKGGSALLQLVVINTGPQTVSLAGVTSPAASGAIVSSVGVPQLTSATTASSDSSSAAASSSASASDSPSTSGSPSSSVSASGSASTSTSDPTTASDSAAAPVVPTSTPIAIPAGQSVQIGFSAIGANILLQGLTGALYPAQTVSVTFAFTSGSGQNATSRTITTNIPVQLNSNPPSAPVVSDATEPAENNN